MRSSGFSYDRLDRRLSRSMLGELAVHHHHYQEHLEVLEQQADFWCHLGVAWTPAMASRWRRGLEGQCCNGELRESLLESVFDLSHDRVREVYEQTCGSEDGFRTIDHLRWGLEKYGLELKDDAALERLLDVAVESKADGPAVSLAEFETIISRLTLALIVMSVETEGSDAPLGDEALVSPMAQASSNGCSTSGKAVMTVCDYSPRLVNDQLVTEAQVRKFFFGHRGQGDVGADPTPLVRWIHLRDYNLNFLLGLTVKYSLHPLAVEDTIEQAPSKADKCGQHYFTTIQGLCLAAGTDESAPVCVGGYHVAVFCAGPPTLDTVITIAQEDRSFGDDWPSGAAECGCGGSGMSSESRVPGICAAFACSSEVDCWADKVRSRLHQPLSRVRERRADFFVYMVLDTTMDEMMAVSKAYRTRLGWMEYRLGEMAHHFPRSFMGEVVLIRRQLHIVSRRCRGLMRAVKKLVEDRDIASGLSAYLQDIIEHCDEVIDDCERLSGKCFAIGEAFNRSLERDRERRSRVQEVQDRRQELRRAAQADRQNNILFVLTIVTTIFAPVQFLAGVYGMNFVDKSGKPGIPELLWKQGYFFFWLAVIGYFVFAIGLSTCLYCCLKRKKHKKKRIEELDLEAGMEDDMTSVEWGPVIPNESKEFVEMQHP